MFEAIYFDLFNTLVDLDLEKLPEVRLEGQTLRTTTVAIYRRLCEEGWNSFSYRELLQEYLRQRRHIQREILRDHRERSCFDRFQRMAGQLGIRDPEIVADMVRTHMDEMSRIMVFPEIRRRTLEALQGYPLVLVSNFDHAATVRRALQRFGLADCFESIFISEEVGWRKPGEEIFKILRQQTPYRPGHSLWVGDDPVADVLGAGRAGFHVAWIRRKCVSTKPNPTPRWVLDHLWQLPELLSGEGI